MMTNSLRPHKKATRQRKSRPLATAASFFDFHRRADSGERLTMAFMGGSLTWGAGASDPQRTSYRALIARRLEQTYPRAHFSFVDAAIGGSGAQLGSFRLERDVLAFAPDLLFLDFTLNDGTYQTSPDTLSAYESIVRRAIMLAGCPVVQMFLASRFDVEKGDTDKMLRRKAHLKISRAYHTGIGDAIVLMQRRYRKKKGGLNLDALWPPDRFDTTHPGDAGYVCYADAAWEGLQKAVQQRVVCRPPAKQVFGDTYNNLNRIPIASLRPLPAGWHAASPKMAALAFDFLMSRWLDSLWVGANFIELDRVKTQPVTPAEPLRLNFHGSTVLLFGESTPRSGKYRVVLDGGAGREFDAGKMGRGGGNGHLWEVIAEGLPAGHHTLEIQPIYESSQVPAELRLESICVAGGEARVWRRE